jgi:hypothetical protein
MGGISVIADYDHFVTHSFTPLKIDLLDFDLAFIPNSRQIGLAVLW